MSIQDFIHRACRAAGFAGLLLAGSAVWAQAPKPPAAGYVFPPVVSAGSSTRVQIGGYDFTSDMQWFLHDGHLPVDRRIELHTDGLPGDYLITPPPYWVGPRAMSTPLPIPREVSVRLAVPAATGAGLVRWQVANANGSSAMAAFYVSTGKSREIIESRSRDLPQRLGPLPVAVSGRISRVSEVDRYEVVTESDGLVSVELLTRRLGTELHGILKVRDAAGQVVADFADTMGDDGGVTFAAKAGEVYTISLNDVDLRGDRAFVNRLAVTSGPRVLCTVPALGQRGSECEVAFTGIGVATGQPVLETIRQRVAFPDDPSLAGHVHLLKSPTGTVEVLIPLSDLNETVRVTPGDGEGSEGGELAEVAEVAGITEDQPSPGPSLGGRGVKALSPQASSPKPQASILEPQPILPPLAVTSVLPAAAADHRYTWQVKKDEYWSIDLASRAIGGRLDVAVSVLGPDGKLVMESDDLPGTTDAGLAFKAATDGMHTCIVRSAASRQGTADEIYRLVIRPQAPDFSLAVPQQVLLPLAGKAEVTVTATRLGGFDGEITVTADALPDGVTATGPWVIGAGKKDVKVTLQSATDAAVVARMIAFQGSAAIGEQQVTRQAYAPASGNMSVRSPLAARTGQVMLAMTMAAPFELLVVDRERQREVHRGTTYLAELDINRNEGFAGEIRIEMSAAQARYRHGMRGPIVTVPGDVNRGIYPITLPEWLPTDVTQRMNVHSVAAVPDPKGTLRYLTKAADSRITMIMEGALLKVSSPAGELVVKAGRTFEVPVRVSRSSKLPLAVTVELVVPEEVKGLLRAEAVTVAANQESGALRVISVADGMLTGPWRLTLKAKAMIDGKWPVVSQVDVAVEFE